jgi:hypothetical protein
MACGEGAPGWRWRTEKGVSAPEAEATGAGDGLGVALKGPHKSAICWDPGGSGGSFGTRGHGAKLTVNTNNQSARPIERLAPAKGEEVGGSAGLAGRRWRLGRGRRHPGGPQWRPGEGAGKAEAWPGTPGSEGAGREDGAGGGAPENPGCNSERSGGGEERTRGPGSQGSGAVAPVAASFFLMHKCAGGAQQLSEAFIRM